MVLNIFPHVLTLMSAFCDFRPPQALSSLSLFPSPHPGEPGPFQARQPAARFFPFLLRSVRLRPACGQHPHAICGARASPPQGHQPAPSFCLGWFCTHRRLLSSPCLPTGPLYLFLNQNRRSQSQPKIGDCVYLTTSPRVNVRGDLNHIQTPRITPTTSRQLRRQGLPIVTRESKQWTGSGALAVCSGFFRQVASHFFRP